jgi:hypothetical protein
MACREDLAERVLAFMRKATPFAYCDACLALRLHASVGDVAAALAALVNAEACERRRRACYGCGRTLEITELVESPPGR